jgi:hypothetical protein
MSYPNQARDVPASSTDDEEGTIDTMEQRIPQDRAPDTEETQPGPADSDEPTSPVATDPDREPDGAEPATDQADDQAQPVDTAWSTDVEHPADDEVARTEPDGEAYHEPPTEAERSTEADRAAEADRDAEADRAAEVDRDVFAGDAEPTTEEEPTREDEATTEAPPFAEAERPSDADRDVYAEPSEPSTVGEPSAEAEPSTEAERADDESPFPAVEPSAGEALPETVPADEATELMPGDVSAEPTADLWPNDTVTGFRDRWRAVQLRFVDDPEGAANEASALVGEVVDSLTSSLATHRGSLDDWRSQDQASDTERLRMTVRRYREFLDRLLDV